MNRFARVAIYFFAIFILPPSLTAQENPYYWSKDIAATSKRERSNDRATQEQLDALLNLRYGKNEAFKPAIDNPAEVLKFLNGNSATLITNEDSRWSSAFTVPGVVDGWVYAMTTDGTNLYVGGVFSMIGGTMANNVIKWDGEKWYPIGEGSENGISGHVSSLAYVDGKLFVGGMMTKAGSKSVNGVAYWDGATWNALGNDETNGIRLINVFEGDTLIHSGHVWSLYGNGDMIYVGGLFHLAGGEPARGAAGWNTKTGEWETFNGGFEGDFPNSLVYGMSFAARGDELYVGGQFSYAGSVPAKNIAKWNGSEWSEVGGGANNWVRDLGIDDEGNLYAVGFFDTVGTIQVSGVAKWNGMNWESLGDMRFVESWSTYLPELRQVYTLNGSVYVGGYFNVMNDEPAASFARWDGNQWHKIHGLGFTHGLSPGTITAIQPIGNRMYIGGVFTTADFLTLNGLVEWDIPSSSWQRISDGSEDKGIYDGAVFALASSDNVTYAGGYFSIAGGVYAKNIANWNGSEWDHMSMGYINGIKGDVYTIFIDGDDVYVGGQFGWAGSVEAYHIAKWNGNEWSSIGIGVGGVSGPSVDAIYKLGNYLYVAGYFAFVGDAENYTLPANSVARFNLTTERWEVLGNGIEYVEGYPGYVEALEYDGTFLYAGGLFSRVDNTEIYGIALWDGEKWLPLQPDGKQDGVDGIVYTIKRHNDDVLFGGYFALPDDPEIQHLVRWDGTAWHGIGGGISSTTGNDRVRAIQPYQDRIIIGGHFDRAGNTPVSNIAMWDGTEWNNLGGGTNAQVNSLDIFGNKLMAGGWFTIVAGGKPSVSIAEYDLTITSVDNRGVDIPSGFQVYQNYPNPFNPSTTIRFALPVRSKITLRIYNILGQEVERLIDEIREPGNQSVVWTTDSTSGIYFYRIDALPESGSIGKFSSTGRMVLLR
jgi:trimeric autotransporter adhesin